MELRADFIVVGGGIAGLRARADLAGGGDILLLTKAGPAESNTGYAQGGIAAAVGPDDSSDLHFDDTLAAGAGLCDEAPCACSSPTVRGTCESWSSGASRSIATPTAGRRWRARARTA